jgi:hypothetical protein
MEKNIGTQDQKLRYGAGAALILAAIFLQSWLLGVLGLVAVGTAYMGTCLAYIPLGINTKKDGE